MAEVYPEILSLAAQLLKFGNANKLITVATDESSLKLSLPIPERAVKIIQNAQQVLSSNPVRVHSGNEFDWTLQLVSQLGGQPSLVVDIGPEITCQFCHETIAGGDQSYYDHLE